MEFSHSLPSAAVAFISNSISVHPGTFLLEPIWLRGLSGSLHLVLLLVLFISFACKKFRAGDFDDSKEIYDRKKGLWCYRWTLFCCYGIFVFNLVWCVLSYFYWYRNGWSDQELVTLLELGLRTLTWGSLSLCLHTQFFNSAEAKFPFLLRVWWGFYLSISSYCLVVDIVLYRQSMSSQVHYLVSDSVSVLTGLFLCFMGFFTFKSEVPHLEEPLLNGSVDDLESTNKSSKGNSATPYSDAGLLSQLTFSWMGSLIAFGNNKALDLEDVPQLHSGDSLVGAFPVFKSKIETENETTNRITTVKLVKALFFSAWKEILGTALLALLYTVASYVGPYLIDAFIQCFNGQGKFKSQGYMLASAFLVGKLVECLSQRHRFFRLQQIGIRMRAVLVAMIYNKGLTLSCQSKQGHTSGEIINFMTVDAERIGDFSWYMHGPWLVILQVGLALFILYKNLGVASVAAFVATIIVMLLNYPLGRLQKNYQEKLMNSKDERMKATSEILRNMRILKLQAWEMQFLSKIKELRNSEAGWLKKFVYSQAIVSFVFWVAPTFVSVVTFGTCMLIGIPLESGKILSALATFRILPDTISMLVQTKVSLDRIASFLCLDDLQDNVVEKLPRDGTAAAIEIENGNFSWDFSASNPTLKDINFKANHGVKVAI